MSANGTTSIKVGGVPVGAVGYGLMSKAKPTHPTHVGG